MKTIYKIQGLFMALLLSLPAWLGAQQNKVTICHNGNTIQVAQAAVPAHLAHGDAVGPCGDCIDPAQIDPTAFCIQVYDPVCGCDGVTYPNSCYAYNAGVTSWTNGACGCINPALINPNQICILIYSPVCGCDGNTYSNSCFAGAAGVTSYTPGPCGPIPLKTSNPIRGKAFDVSPNPVDGPANIHLLGDVTGFVKLELMSLDGRVVKNLHEGEINAGQLYEFTLDAGSLPSGIYLCHVAGAGFNNSLKIVVR